MTAWISSWFKTPNKVNLEETTDELVYSETLKRWIKKSEIKDTINSSEDSLDNSNDHTYFIAPPIIDNNVMYVRNTSINGRRPRYIDPFTNEVHNCSVPVVEVMA